MKRFVQFGVVGALGFAFDAGVLLFLVSTLGMNIYAARMLSFLLAVVFTFLLNRRFAFRALRRVSGTSFGDYLRYLSVQSAGALISLGVFFSAVMAFPSLRSLPVVPLAMGSAVAMAFNYIASRYYVFANDHDVTKRREVLRKTSV